MNDAETLTKASQAKRLLEDPVLTDAFDAVRQAILYRIEQAPIRDREGAHELRLCLKLLRDVRANLEQAVNEGKLVEFRLQEQKRMDLLKQAFGFRRAV